MCTPASGNPQRFAEWRRDPQYNGINTTNHDGYLYASMTATKPGFIKWRQPSTMAIRCNTQDLCAERRECWNHAGSLEGSGIADNNDLTTLTATVADTEGMR